MNARGSRPSDYARYAEFETNVDALRRKRVKRLGIKATAHNGQRRIFYIFDRGTRKFPGDLDLWMQSIENARRQMAQKKLSQILTNALRLHPTKPDLWIYGAQFAIEEHADMTEARSYMQRGLRFCKFSRALWISYFKLELLYIAKIAARRKILGIDAGREPASMSVKADDVDADILELPVLTEEDIFPLQAGRDDIDEIALQTLDSTPATSGTIPMAIFDASVLQFENDQDVGKAFFDKCLDADDIPCLSRILQHIVDRMMEAKPQSWQAQACSIKVPLIGVRSDSPKFPAALKTSLSRLKQVGTGVKESPRFVQDMSSWLEALLKAEELDPALSKIIIATRRRIGDLDS